MFAVTSPWLYWTLLSVSVVGFTCAECIQVLMMVVNGAWIVVSGPINHKNITADSGQKNITLTCRASNIKNDLVEWSRADLGDEYVLFYRDGHFVPDHQHPSFKNRVDLQDRQMKDGDVSLILNNVTSADDGTYQCRVRMDEKCSWKLISIIYLSVVVPPGQTGGYTEDGGKEDKVNRHYGLVTSGLFILVLLVSLVIVSKLPNRNLSNHLPSDEPADICSEIRVSGG